MRVFQLEELLELVKQCTLLFVGVIEGSMKKVWLSRIPAVNLGSWISIL